MGTLGLGNLTEDRYHLPSSSEEANKGTAQEVVVLVPIFAPPPFESRKASCIMDS